jgi:folate-binding protein YgfZ
MTEAPYFSTLPNRGLIRISGADRRPFLQGLISNDIYLLDRQPSLYACLLNAQGKFLHDFFLTEKNGTIFIDCEGDRRAEDISRRFLMYKLRAKVEITCEKQNTVYAVFGKDIGVPDTRHPDMGYRSFEKPEGLPEKSFEEWDRHRISLGIPDGSRDMIVDKSNLLESNIDTLNGISYEKGCFVGQELTARMHYRALVKKRMQTVNVNALPEGAELRSSCGDIGLALVKVES